MINKKIGILGGGQLGRMFIQSAIDYGINVNILDPDPNAPCKSIAENFHAGSIKDFDTVVNFGKDLDIITIEIEQVNAKALKELEKQGKKVFPQPEVIELIQDKRSQKIFYQKNKIPTSDFILVENKAEIAKNSDFFPAFNKLAKDGYDGRGVQKLVDENDLDSAFDAPGLLEKLVDIEKEISIIVGRNESGKTVVYPAVELVYHEGQNLVDYLISPANISAEIEKEAQEIALKIIEKLNMVGILAVEMFIDKEGKLLVNEVAPRPHNSGHHSIEGNFTSQYEQHLRAIVNFPLGSPKARQRAAMVNILGEEGYTGKVKYVGFEKAAELEGCYVHLYGKETTKPFRKMGHVTVVGDNKEELIEKIEKIKSFCKVISE
ncbi:5-(carboxyamino)imidazole ribonucleotide synthase [Flexithrix dorotheae]|uniref:5-(carboxyamino)imidazole ribonucleotide synthase n=1 Tax=Flexithrix dorotheae TaxID=70993 RepID=UPI00036AF39C|nr:5-(carboxyamino)imidazole ribonucleotide synthase [Flexithrix dorotheae]